MLPPDPNSGMPDSALDGVAGGWGSWNPGGPADVGFTVVPRT